MPRYSPRTGMTRLVTVRVARASADQRRGRAGRQAPGACYRLWSSGEEATLLPRMAPEILEADLAPLALELALAGADPADLGWLDPPPAPALGEARRLLVQLGALDVRGRITEHGRRIARFSLHPRLAHMVLRGREGGAGDLACDLAALLTERDVLRRAATWRPGPGPSDRASAGRAYRADVDRDALRRARAEAGCARQLPVTARRPVTRSGRPLGSFWRSHSRTGSGSGGPGPPGVSCFGTGWGHSSRRRRSRARSTWWRPSWMGNRRRAGSISPCRCRGRSSKLISPTTSPARMYSHGIRRRGR